MTGLHLLGVRQRILLPVVRTDIVKIAAMVARLHVNRETHGPSLNGAPSSNVKWLDAREQTI